MVEDARAPGDVSHLTLYLHYERRIDEVGFTLCVTQMRVR